MFDKYADKQTFQKLFQSDWFKSHEINMKVWTVPTVKKSYSTFLSYRKHQIFPYYIVRFFEFDKSNQTSPRNDGFSL